MAFQTLNRTRRQARAGSVPPLKCTSICTDETAFVTHPTQGGQFKDQKNPVAQATCGFDPNPGHQIAVNLLRDFRGLGALFGPSRFARRQPHDDASPGSWAV